MEQQTGCFSYRNGELYVEDVAVQQLIEQFGTPLYVYSKRSLDQKWQQFESALQAYPYQIYYAVKANSNLTILNQLAQKGCGFDIVSQGEMERVLVAGGDVKKMVFSGVGKTTTEIIRALGIGIGCLNVESLEELERIHSIASTLKIKAPISLRINPDIDAKTHPYISTGLKEDKFGISYQRAHEAYRKADQMPFIEIKGISCHIGSQLTELAPFIEAVEKLLTLVDELKREKIIVSHLNIGGGLGVVYRDEKVPTINDYVAAILKTLKNYSHLTICFEPGRVLVADMGILVSRVEYLKEQDDIHFAIIDAGMNDLIRPALYQSWMRILSVKENAPYPEQRYQVVGPICESSDTFGSERPLRITEGDSVAIMNAGAYGFSMSSHYNSRPRVAEILVTGSQTDLIREREQLTDLWRGEKIVSKHK